MAAVDLVSSTLRYYLRQAYGPLWQLVHRGATKRLKEDLRAILASHASARDIVVFLPSVPWHLPLFQRPQQLALAMARQGCLVFYCEPFRSSSYPMGFHEVHEGLFLARLPLDVLGNIQSPVVFSLVYNVRLLRHFMAARVVYEYIDELGVFPGPRARLEREHAQIVKSASVVVATSLRLFQRVATARPDALLCPNGVDYAFIRAAVSTAGAIPLDFRQVVDGAQAVIGYYGAMAEWFDYELLKRAASMRPQYQFVLIGPDYDGTVANSGLDECANVHWLGPRPYLQLPQYLKHFDVAIIPFRLNEITHSTSPLKLFEYMAAGKPVVATPMHECTRYDGVLTARGPREFADAIDDALRLRRDPSYLSLIDRVARENTWDRRAAMLLEAGRGGTQAGKRGLAWRREGWVRGPQS